MNNNIQESYCSFEVSKLLKEKGFDVMWRQHYELALTSKKDKQDGYSGPFGWKKGELNVQNHYNTNSSLSSYYDDKNWYACSRPTHTIAIEWLRVNFGLVISSYPHYLKWSYTIDKIDETNKYNYVGITNGRNINPENFNSPQETIEAALKYVLTSLI